MNVPVLIVDDSSVMRAMLRKSLELSGYAATNVLEAADGSEALGQLTKGRIELVFVDIHMPGMGGFELIERMSKQPELQNIPVVVISSDATEVILGQLKQRGVRAVLRKPFRPEQVRALMRNLAKTGGSEANS